MGNTARGAPGTLALPMLGCRVKSRILLEDGTGIEACGFGYEGVSVGELVFTTAMTGYPESLTDPSYAGQILVITHPHVGNYGVPRVRTWRGLALNMESESVKVSGLIVSDYPDYSHPEALWSLGEWLASDGVPGAYGVDTRWLVKKIRSMGVMQAVVATGEDPPGWGELSHILETSPRYDEVDYASLRSPRRPITYKPPGRARGRVSLLDCGVKHGIIRSLLDSGLEVTRMPCDSKAEDLLEGFDGVVLGSGPGNPELLKRQASTAGDLVASGKPVLGVCLGMQLLALGMGAGVYKMKFGHRGVNKPVKDLETGRCYITTHNHGYAVDPDTLGGAGLKPWFVNPDDGTLEGVKVRGAPVIATQFHPEAGPGPWDTRWIFRLFSRMVEGV
ncbi:MAG: glutamine-hydrolyzing carbamoyl-phosphate synthase small subunit [Desulfurococcales archaeon]|nr:glutamine-hydrolyzing carbamoyl-phosphate synthase small subunit [Desulfurococcales archaeon]